MPKHSLPPQKQILTYWGRFTNCPYGNAGESSGLFLSYFTLYSGWPAVLRRRARSCREPQERIVPHIARIDEHEQAQCGKHKQHHAERGAQHPLRPTRRGRAGVLPRLFHAEPPSKANTTVRIRNVGQSWPISGEVKIAPNSMVNSTETPASPASRSACAARPVSSAQVRRAAGRAVPARP